jgi:hypothetical protein
MEQPRAAIAAVENVIYYAADGFSTDSGHRERVSTAWERVNI